MDALIEGPIPALFVLWHLAASAWSFAQYGFDKARAARAGRRVRESRLHLADALGGWPGGLLAMRVFRHKRRKAAFVRVFWVTVVVHVAVVGLLVRLFG